MSRILPGIAFFFCFFSQSFAQSVYDNVEVNKCSHALTKFAGREGSHVARSGELNSYDVKFYFLDLQADNTSSFVKGNVSMKAQAVTPMTQVVLELADVHNIDSIFIDGVKTLNYTHSNGLVTITLPGELSAGGFFTSKIYYSGDGATASFFSGISTNGAYTWTLSEPTNARDWFPCKQVLEDKADSAYIYITVPPNLKAGSNGLLTNVTALEDSRLRYEWKTYYPIAYYLISMSIGEYDEYTTYATIDGHEMPVLTYLYPGTLDDIYPGMTETQQALLNRLNTMVEQESELFGPYPFANEKYGHCQAPMGGGMEHQTMSTMTNFSFTLCAHELGHQWFGDNVTCSSWQHIWVNEGFARYTEYLMYERLVSKAQADVHLHNLQNSAISAAGGSIYVPDNQVSDINRIFDLRLTYNKGASVIHMIRKLVNDDDLFFDILRTYQTQFKNGVASADDLRGVIETKSGMDFGKFFDEWYYGEGYPRYAIRWNFDSDTLYIQQTQSTSTTKTKFFNIPADYRIGYSDNTFDTLRLQADSNSQLFKIPQNKTVQSVEFDPEGWLLKKVTSFSHSTTLKYTPPAVVTGVGEQKSVEFSLYPNPSSGQLIIHSNDDSLPFAVRILSIHGKTVYNGKGDAARIVSTAHFPPGIYVVEIEHRHGITTKKVEVVR